MTTEPVATFNVNQFDIQRQSPRPLAHQKADLIARMEKSAIVLTQETVELDLAAFVADPDTIRKVGAWGAYQIRNGDNDGHANTAVLYRLKLGTPTAVEWAFLGDMPKTRIRGLACVQFNDREWYASGHIFPARDRAGIPTQLANLSKWVAAHPGPVVIGLDRNQCPPGSLEQATGLRWHGVGIDGFLTNCKVANVAEFPKGFSDHPGVRADVTITDPPKPNRAQRAGDLLHRAERNAKAHGRTGRLARIREALKRLGGK
jgi:hypothetical protein